MKPSPPVAPEWAEAFGKPNCTCTEGCFKKATNGNKVRPVLRMWAHVKKKTCQTWGHVVFFKGQPQAGIQVKSTGYNYHKSMQATNPPGELPSLYQSDVREVGTFQNPHPPWDIFLKLLQLAPLPIIDLGRFRITIRTNVIFGFEIPSKVSQKMEIQTAMPNSSLQQWKFLTFTKSPNSNIFYVIFPNNSNKNMIIWCDQTKTW